MAVVVTAVGLVGFAALNGGLDRLARLTRPATVTVAAPVPGTRTLDGKVRLLVLVDASGSVTRSDPHDARLTETAALVDMLAASPDNRRDQVQIGFFTDELVFVTAPERPSNPAGLARLHTALTPADLPGGTTDIAAAVEGATRECQRSPEATNVVLLVTDGQDDLDKVAASVAESSCDQLHLFALNQDHVFGAALQEGYQQMAGLARIWRADTSAAGVYASTLVEILVEVTGQATPSGGFVRTS